MATTPVSLSDSRYSFMVHTNASPLPDSPVALDDSNSTKQKRRRTSPRDHAILEAAYQRNSKPDKHERTEIVNRVNLGEKEVQIWFQNRRQNDRRKSKPLQPHELLAHFRNGVPVQALQAMSTTPDERIPSVEKAVHMALDTARPSSRSSSIHELLNPTSSTTSVDTQIENTSVTKETPALPTPPSSFEVQPLATTSVPGTAMQVAQTGAQSSHNRKRSHEVMAKDEVQGSTVSPPKPVLQPATKAPLARSSSFVRLAMTVDGAVKVRTTNEPTPSPPKQRALPPSDQPRTRESFGRSQSAIESSFGFKEINPPIRKLGAPGFGRSRDARTWEFYCDRDSGDALITQAEAERNGSAIGAINLIRSQNLRQKSQPLSPNVAKQNSRRSHFDQRERNPKLARTTSSMGRLQSSDVIPRFVDDKAKHNKAPRSPSGDSDKENWAPGTMTSVHDMRRMHSTGPRDSILVENDLPIVVDTSSSGTAQQPAKEVLTGKEKTKTEDLDCVQGLLSLSQGAWR